MPDSPSQLRLLFAGPCLCALLLAGMTVDNRRYHGDADATAFHVRAAAAIAAIPLTLPPWIGREEPLAADELALLRPNAYRCVAFSDTRAAALGDPSRRVLMLVTQCRRAADMSGHYPPNCYPSRGYLATGGPGRPRAWRAGGRAIGGTEYFFERRAAGRTARTCVYNFMVLPQQGVRPDMESVVASAEDYQQRYYGAAQFQLVFGGSMAEATPAARQDRDAAFAELIGPCAGVVTTLCDGRSE